MVHLCLRIDKLMMMIFVYLHYAILKEKKYSSMRKNFGESFHDIFGKKNKITFTKLVHVQKTDRIHSETH